MLSDRTDALVARVNTVQVDFHGAMRSEDETDLLRNRLRAAEDLLSQLQGRLSATEVLLVDARTQAEALAAEQAAQMAATQVSLYYVPSPLCAYSTQSQATTTTAQTRKRKRSEDEVEGGEDGNNVTEGEEDKQGYSVRARRPEVPARKRTRRIARAAVHTAAAVVIGAVAAWSALAFM
jgi:carbohydrate-binding DOMON domain-containing protein